MSEVPCKLVVESQPLLSAGGAQVRVRVRKVSEFRIWSVGFMMLGHAPGLEAVGGVRVLEREGKELFECGV